MVSRQDAARHAAVGSRDKGSAYFVSEDCACPLGILKEGSYLQGHWLNETEFVVVKVNDFEITPTFLVSSNHLKTEDDL